MNFTKPAVLLLLINFSLLSTYAVFWLARHLIKGLKIDVRASHLVRWSQALIVLSILSPMAFHALPSRYLPNLDFGVFLSESEDRASGIDRLYPTRVHSLSRVLPQAAPTKAPSRPLLSRLTEFLKSESSATAVTLALLLWTLGVFVHLVHFRRNIGFLRELIARSSQIRRIGRVRAVISDEVVVPFSVRLDHISWVVLPHGIVSSGRDLRISLLHELQHHRRHDTVWAWVSEGLQCLFYPNPGYFLWKKDISELQEFSCDEALLGRGVVTSRDYGSCLLRVAETALGRQTMYAGTTCMATISKNSIFQKSLLRRRVEMLVEFRKTTAQGGIPEGIALIFGIASLFMSVLIAYGADQVTRRDVSNGINPGHVTVDAGIQEITENILRQEVKNQKAASGFAIVADPITGRILAVANVGEKKKGPGLHWALAERLEPASLVKTLVVANAIEKGLVTPEEKINCERGSYRYGGRVYHDWRKEGWESLSTTDAIAYSSDICTIKIGERLGTEGLRNMLSEFGFGPKGSARAFPEAQPGTLPPQDDPSQPRLIPYVASGQGFQVTPIEMVQAYGAIANGGSLLEPQPANGIQRKVIRRVLSAENARKVKEILREVVKKGTAKGRANSDLYTTAGKTATGHSVSLNELDWFGGKKMADVAGFIGFAPFESPQVEVYVGIRDPHTDKTGAHGSHHAAPVFKKIIEAVLKQMKVVPDSRPQG